MSDIEKVESPQRRCQVGNPAPLGLFSFASTTLVLSLYNVHARHVSVPNVIVGMALFYGGLAQFLAGMWEFAAGNTFGATAFTSYGAFWLSFATLLIPDSGISAAYTADPGMEQDAIGIYLLAWMIVTFLFFIGSLRKSIGLSALFFFLTLTFMLLAIGFMMKKLNVVKAGGYVGIVTAAIAYYDGLADMLTANDLFTIPTGKHAPRRD
ncbi:Gpr1 family protein [Russula earlei]|uniref:Gpr1 family protein n=1 Tax=Russula earlei TaxID=71964 RepID=A0ACC0U3D9_9AGAM|nr:Gpr1 family protein [Russula earlei]